VTKEAVRGGCSRALGGFWGFIISEGGHQEARRPQQGRALGTGPFMLEDWKVEQQLVLKKKPLLLEEGSPLRGRAGAPRHPRRGQTSWPRCAPGQIHHAFHRGQQELQPAQGREDPHRLPQLAPSATTTSTSPATRGPPQGTWRVRQAISWAVDRSQVLRVAAGRASGRLTAPATAPMKQWQLPEEAWMKYYKPDVEKAQES